MIYQVRLSCSNKMHSTTLYFIFILLVGLSSGIAAHGQTVTSSSTSEGSWIIQYDIDDGILSYAVIAGPSKGEITGPVIQSSTYPNQEDGKVRELGKKAIFQHPNGDEINLVGTGRVIHVSSGIVSELVEPIDPKTFEAFLRSGTDDLRLSALLRFQTSRAPD